ncbi:hypothetical protein D3C83_78510 [compost metagenome]
MSVGSAADTAARCGPISDSFHTGRPLSMRSPISSPEVNGTTTMSPEAEGLAPPTMPACSCSAP